MSCSLSTPLLSLFIFNSYSCQFRSVFHPLCMFFFLFFLVSPCFVVVVLCIERKRNCQFFFSFSSISCFFVGAIKVSYGCGCFEFFFLFIFYDFLWCSLFNLSRDFPSSIKNDLLISILSALLFSFFALMFSTNCGTDCLYCYMAEHLVYFFHLNIFGL